MLTADVVQIKTHTQKKQFSDYQWERDERGERGKGKGIKCNVGLEHIQYCLFCHISDEH